jgi:hypothetical protein
MVRVHEMGVVVNKKAFLVESVRRKKKDNARLLKHANNEEESAKVPNAVGRVDFVEKSR